MDEVDLREYLRRNCSNRRFADFVYGLDVLGLPAVEAAREAGYSPGISDDPTRQKSQLSAVASKTLRKDRVVLLRKKLADYRKRGEARLATADEAIEQLTEVLRTGTDTAKIQAAKSVLEHHRRGVQNRLAPDQVPALLESACRPDRSLFIQVIATSAALIWKRNGMASLKDWEPPEHMQRVANLMERHGFEPLEALLVMRCE